MYTLRKHNINNNFWIFVHVIPPCVHKKQTKFRFKNLALMLHIYYHYMSSESVFTFSLWSQLSSLVEKRGKEKLFSTKTRFIENLNLNLLRYWNKYSSKFLHLLVKKDYSFQWKKCYILKGRIVIMHKYELVSWNEWKSQKNPRFLQRAW